MTRSLFVRYLRNDIAGNKGVTSALLVVLVLSAFLMASGAMMMERLAGSVTRMFQVAEPPHFLQMHRGDYDRTALETFASGRAEIDAWQIEEMVGFSGHAISWQRPATGERGLLSESLIDNLFVAQNREFDFLIDETDAAPQPGDGQVYVPVAYEQQFGLQAGDRLSVATDRGSESLEVVGFVRDAQMASSMSSATRFLVSDGDLTRLGAAGGGTPEIIVEYRLTDTSKLGEFQRAYESNADLPRNGQAVTEVMIRLVNMFSDGLVAVAFMFASLLLIAIALLNVRFVIRGTLEDEIHEIGAMKAIGLTNRTISRLYLGRYGAMTLVACVVGGVLATLAVNALTSGMRANFAAAPVTLATVLAPVAALVVLFLLVLGICAGVLRAVGRMDVVGALIHGSTTSAKKEARQRRRTARRVRKPALAGAHAGNLSRRLALLDLRAERGQWLLVPAVFLITAVLITLPTSVLHTLEDPRFVTNMGAPQADLRADIQFPADGDEAVDDTAAKLVWAMEADDRIDAVHAFAGMSFESPGEDGWEVFRVEVGDYTGTTLVFTDGTAPGAGELALSALNADKYGVSPGDSFVIRRGGAEQTLRVSGIYSDVTSGGFTAKLHGEPTAGADRWVIYADVIPGADPDAVAKELGAASTATVIGMQEYVGQTLAYVTDALRTAALLTLAFGLGSAALIITLFLRLKIAKDKHAMGVLAVVGFSRREIAGQLRLKTLVAVAVGTVLGVVFAGGLGEPFVGSLLSIAGLGITRLNFLPNPWIVYAGYPALLVGIGVAAAFLVTRRLRDADQSEWLR